MVVRALVYYEYNHPRAFGRGPAAEHLLELARWVVLEERREEHEARVAAAAYWDSY